MSPDRVPRFLPSNALWLLAAIAAAVLWGLGDRYLWEDEAETALLARQVLERGLPYALAGAQSISQELLHEVGWDGLWIWTPWTQIYLAAVSFALLGQSAWSARLPFALAGLAGLWVFFQAAVRFFDGDRRRAWLALFLVGTSVPLLLHFRQCRWYGPAFLEFACWWLGYWQALKDERRGDALLVFGMAGLFHTQQLAFAAAAGSFLVSHLLFFPRRTRRLVRPVLLAASLCLPWLLLQRHFSPVTPYPVTSLWKFLFYLAEVNAHHLPLVLLLPWLIWRARRSGETPEFPRPLAFALVFLACYLVLISLGSYPHFYRYLVPVLGVVGLVQARMAADLLQFVPRAAAWPLLLLLAGTNLFHTALAVHLAEADHPAHARPHFLWWDYLYELRTPYAGPIGSIVRRLEADAREGDVVWITYGDLPLRFHTPLRVYGGLGGANFRTFPEPDWVILRSQTIAGPKGYDQAFRRYAEGRLRLREEFERIELPVADVAWENRPDPDYHPFRAPDYEPPVVLFHRKARR